MADHTWINNAGNGPALLTGLSTGSWTEDLDLSDDANFVGSAPTVPSGATGVVLRFHNDSATGYEVGTRMPGSTTDRHNDLISSLDRAQTEQYVGLSGTTIDVYIESADVDVYVIAFFGDGVGFFSDGNQYGLNASTASTWQEHDLSSYLSSNAVFAIFEISRNNNDWGWNFRHPSSSDDRTVSNMMRQTCAIVPVDSQTVELWSESTVTTFTLIGEITSNATNRTSGGDVSLSTTGSYQTVDFSSFSPPSGTALAVVEIYSSTLLRRWAIREYGDTSYTDIYADLYNHQWCIMPVDGSSYCQAKIEDTALDFFVWGWLQNASGTTVTLTKGTLAVAGGIVLSNYTIGLGVQSLLFTGKILSSFVGTLLTLITTALGFTGKTLLQNDTKNLVPGSVAFSGKTTFVNETPILGVGSLGIIGKLLSFGNTVIMIIGSLAVTGRNLFSAMTQVLNSGSVALTGKDMAAVGGTIITMIVKALSLTGKILFIDQVVNLTKGILYFSGKPLMAVGEVIGKKARWLLMYLKKR